MATSSKYDLSSGSPDGPVYSNGQRGPYGAGFLERSGNFREGMDNRISTSLPSMLKSGSTLSQGDPTYVFQSLLSDLKSVILDQKFPRPGELKRAASSIFSFTPEESIPATISTKPLPSSSMEEVKRVKANLLDGSSKARDRVKAFGEAVSKIDKYCQNMSRKRSRADVASGERSNALFPGGSVPKSGSQSLMTANDFEPGPQRSEDRAKGSVPSKRVRTSMVEARMDVRVNSVPRPAGLLDRDRDVFKIVNGGTALPEEKGRALPSGVDGWEKPNMKKKRSVIKSDVSASPIVGKLLDGDREPKGGMQQKAGTDGRPRMNSAHGFRSRAANGASGLGTSDLASQQNGIGMRPSPRSDQDNGSLLSDRRDGRAVGLDKEGATHRTANKLNGREDNSSASPTSLTKLNPSARGPRSNSGSVSKGSQSIQRPLENSDDLELSQCTDKVNSVNGAINRKRATSSQSLSPSVAQWCGQRPQKISRVARRSNLPPLVSSHDEFPGSDTIESTSITDDRLEVGRRMSSNASQVKLRGDHVSTTGLSESDDSGIVENKSSNKIKKCSEIETSQTVQKVAALSLPPRRTKVSVDEDLGDGVRRQGRSGRGSAPTRSGMPATVEKSDDATTTKQMRSARLGYEKVESKPGRPPTKKMSERKGYTRPRHSLNNSSVEFAGESDDDHEELLAAANAALQTRHACISSFWKQIEPIFALVSADEVAYLNEQICLTNESAACNRPQEDEGHNVKGNLQYASLLSSPAPATKDNSDTTCAGIGFSECDRDIRFVNQTKHREPILEQLVQGIDTRSGISICQALLSAIIEEEEMENFYSRSCKEEEFLHDFANGLQSEFNSDLKTKILNGQSWGNFQTVEGTASNGYKLHSSWRYSDDLHEKLGNNGAVLEPSIGDISSFEHVLDELFPSQTMVSNSGYAEVQYNQMCISDRILSELSEIGLHPEAVPALAQSEDEDITEEISNLEEKLQEQVKKKKSLLLKVEKAVSEARDSQDRELEHIAVDKLVGMAYDKYMACWGPNSKNVNKITKHATLAFIKRTLARCRKFEETGSSCFSEPAFRDIFHSVSSHSIDAECIKIAADGKDAASNSFAPSRNSDNNSSITSNSVQRIETHGKNSNSFPSDTHVSEQTYSKEEQWSSRVKKRELLLDDVVGTAAGMPLRALSGFGSSLSSGTKGKRSERDRDGKGHNRDAVARNGTVKVGRPSLSNVKGERKNKTRPKQKTTQLSASVNGLVSKVVESNQVIPSVPKSHGGGNNKAKNDSSLPPNCVGMQDLSNDTETTDLCNLQLPELDVGDFGGQGQDIGSWLNIDDDALQDHDFMGLEIPMDDLSEVNMMI